MLLNPEIITNLLLDTLFVFLGGIAFVVSIKVVLFWDLHVNDTNQFRLQKNSYLTSTIAKYILLIKIPLVLFFIHTLDSLAPLINGAMCGVGVLDTSTFGNILMVLKVLNIYLFSFWIVLNIEDYKHPYLPYTKIKSLFFIIIYLFLVTEVYFEYRYFLAVDPKQVVDCCGVIFSASSQNLMGVLLSIDHTYLYEGFYLILGILVISYIANWRVVYAILSVVFIPVALISLIGYFGTYIYELPTHHCPFCLMQGDYDYIGYFLYTALFIGSFFGIVQGFYVKNIKYLRVSFLFTLCYSMIVSFYPIFYYLKNGVWLY